MQRGPLPLVGRLVSEDFRPWRLALLGWVLLNSLGGILAEKAYKSGDLPFFAKFVTEDFGYLLIQSLLMLLIGLLDPEQDVLRRGFFDAWDQRTVALLLVLLLDATVGSLLLQEFSALTKCITKAFCAPRASVQALQAASMATNWSFTCTPRSLF